ncbi:MAG: 1-(5-phosphoribosyl)-5-[(5-phosphoribosylamino)methylideneamino]imidazole-4-carboxamide isomerase [Bacteroidales bacterium]|jgi:phosphoribosylformimino-5-aminoimidazole carboxamide ribotide isomerase|nr:1-(5-phosphoribosyl)-5-[(5-phosphoribosylamino)methylideneamino]imidazole-4-carboxamide isomerase [Bacteroidales bacterium]
MRIIIAIDILDGKCVRLTRGDYRTKKIYNEDPLEAAKMIEDSGLKYLHLVDLDGAKNKRIINSKVLEKIAAKTGLIIDFGGGIRSDEDLKIAFHSGASQVTGGSIAVSSPSSFLDWIRKYGNEKIILGADCKNRKVTTEGWTEKSEVDIIKFISGYCTKGLLYSICTDVNKDGMMKGPGTELYREILRNTKLNLIASGGISSIKDIEDIKEAGCEGVIIGKAIYEGKIKLKELRDIC